MGFDDGARLGDGGGRVFAFAQQPGAQHGVLLDEDDALVMFGGAGCFDKARMAAAQHQHIAECRAMGVVVRVGLDRRAAKARRAADQVLVDHPLARGAKEGLVIEARGKDRAQQRERGADIAAGRGPAVLAGGGKAIIDKDVGCPRIGRGARALADGDQRARLFDARRQDAAWAVVFETSADQRYAIGQEGGGQRIAGAGGVAFAVEGEGEARAIRAVVPEGAAAHVTTSPWGTTAWIAWLTLSRRMVSHWRQP